MTGVVGPNGCGKSNIIDAVRWVMGESSASRLRGDSLTDVIFSGSSTRKPVSQATVELIFDNSEGTIGGEYARYAEISVKRSVSRDGQSNYYLNGARCRRRDITDLPWHCLVRRQLLEHRAGMIPNLSRPPRRLLVYRGGAGISSTRSSQGTNAHQAHSRELDRLTDLREK